MAHKQQRNRSWRHWFGRVKAIVGNHTGDRRVEAEGTLEAATGRPPDEEAVERELQATRRQYKDIPRIRRGRTNG